MSGRVRSSIDASEALVAEWLKGLAYTRPLFHSEADFQHALAWHIHTETRPECRVRLEFKPPHDRNLYLDIWLPDGGIAIELKYKTRRRDLTIGGEAFQLREQSAHDCGRYDFLQDVSRLEALMDDCAVEVKRGFAIFLTNDARYWEYPRFLKNPRYRKPNDCGFRIHDGHEVGGCLEWHKPSPEWRPTNREESIRLRGTYGLKWSDYSCCGTGDGDRFRYLLVEVAPAMEPERTGRSLDS